MEAHCSGKAKQSSQSQKIEGTQNVRVKVTKTWYKRTQKHPPILGLAGAREPGLEAGSLIEVEGLRVRRLAVSSEGSRKLLQQIGRWFVLKPLLVDRRIGTVFLDFLQGGV